MISLTVPQGATSTPVNFYVASVSSPSQVSQGDIDLNIRALKISDNSSVSNFDKVLDIHYWVQFVDSVPRLVENGESGTVIASLQTALLPESMPAGYFVYGDRTYSILTRTLSTIFFDLIQEELLLKVKNGSLRVGEEAQLQYSGGSGTGALQFTSENPEICSVTASGLVKALKLGFCTIRLTKLGDASHLATSSDDFTFLITLSRQELRSLSSPRNQLIYARPQQDYQIFVNLASRFANKTGTLQLRRYERGVLVYRTIGEVALNSHGNAIYDGKKSLLNGTRIRLVVDGMNIAFTTARQ